MTTWVDALAVAGVTVLLVVLLAALRAGVRRVRRRGMPALDARIARSRHAVLLRLFQPAVVVRLLSTAAAAFIAVVLSYLWLAFVMRRFHATRSTGEALRALLWSQSWALAQAAAAGLPGLFTVVMIGALAWLASRVVVTTFAAVGAGRLSLPGVYPDTAAATRRLIIAALWIVALVAAYPYVPGTDSPGFKAIGVALGLIVSLGSSGVVQHLMSGLMLTFARAIHVGDFARIGDVEGTVLQVGAVATKLRTARGEEVTIPNAVVVGQTTTNYSAPAGTSPSRLTTSVTIGYDTPWRQVEALLLQAAGRTIHLRESPAPVVWVTALNDFYVTYVLMVTPREPAERPQALNELHAHILDAFNTHGVQIMSPHYRGDPAGPKVVPPERWHLPPATPAARPRDLADRS